MQIPFAGGKGLRYSLFCTDRRPQVPFSPGAPRLDAKTDKSCQGETIRSNSLSISFVRNTRMAISKDKKREILAKLSDAFKEASAIAFVGFTKLTVADASRMRKELSQAGVRYFVAKKTLIRRALAERGYQGDIPELPGEVAVAWTTEEVTAPARGIYEYSRKLKGALSLLAAYSRDRLRTKRK